jgi:hypothetical protein
MVTVWSSAKCEVCNTQSQTTVVMFSDICVYIYIYVSAVSIKSDRSTVPNAV